MTLKQQYISLILSHIHETGTTTFSFSELFAIFQQLRPNQTQTWNARRLLWNIGSFYRQADTYSRWGTKKTDQWSIDVTKATSLLPKH